MISFSVHLFRDIDAAEPIYFRVLSWHWWCHWERIILNSQGEEGEKNQTNNQQAPYLMHDKTL